MGVGVVVSIAAAILVGLLALNAFPLNPERTPTPGGFEAPPGPEPAYYEILSSKNVTCSLNTGGCTLTLVNNSTVPLSLVACQIESFPNDTSGQVFNGTIGGTAAVTGIAANSQGGASCTVSTSALASVTVGTYISGWFTVKLVQGWNGYPAGLDFPFNFQTIWSSANQTTTTSSTVTLISSTICTTLSNGTSSCQ